MSQPPIPPKLPPFPDADVDDQLWFDLLAGRSAPDAPAAVRNDAAWLRAALLSYRAQAPAGGPAEAGMRITRLLARARAEGVLPPATNTPVPRGALPTQSPALPARWWQIGRWHKQTKRRSPRWGVALAASLVVLGVALLSLRQPVDDSAGSGVLRGATLQQINTGAPEQSRAQLLQALQAAGFDAHPFDRLGRPGIDIALPVPLPATQARTLRNLGLSAPDGPALQVEFLALPQSAASAP